MPIGVCFHLENVLKSTDYNMSNALPQKRTDVCSVTAGVDANDSGFSELCHGGDGEEGAWPSSRSPGEQGGAAEKAFRQVYVHRASTPNRSAQYHYPVPIGVPFCSPEPVTCVDIKKEPMNVVSYSANCSDPVSIHGQLQRDAKLTYVSNIPYMFDGARSGFVSASTAKEPGNRVTSSLTSTNPLAGDLRPVSYYYDATTLSGLSQLTAPVKTEPCLADNVHINDKPGTGAQMLAISPNDNRDFNKVEHTDTGLPIKREPEAAPVLDLRRQPVGTLDQLLKVPPSYGTVTVALPEVRTLLVNHRTPSVTPATDPGRPVTSPLSTLLAAERASYTYATSPSTLSAIPPQYPSSYRRNEDLILKSEREHVFDHNPAHRRTFLSDGLSDADTGATYLSKTPSMSGWAPFYSPAKSNSIARQAIADIRSSSSKRSRTVSFSDTTDDGHSPIAQEKVNNAGTYAMDVPACVTDRGRVMDNPCVPGLGRMADSLSTIRPRPDTHATISDFSDDDVSGTKTTMGASRADISSPYSDISGDDTHTDHCATTSESSGDETTRAAHAPFAGVRKNRKWKRKSLTPRRSPDKRDPRFKGVTIWLQTEFKNGDSQLHLSAFYSNVKVGVAKPAYVVRRAAMLPGDCQSCSEAEGNYSPPTHARDTYASVKTCASCRTRRTPLWRDAEDGTPLCNACGIRYKKYRLRCSRCWFIPKKDIKTYPNCPACGSALRYSFHRKAW